MKYIYLTIILALVSIELVAQDGPIIIRSGACDGYSMTVNTILYENGQLNYCWDTNNNGINDASEDTNSDGIFNVLDCAGGYQCWDFNGNGVGDALEDLNNDGVLDIFDCPDCWDTNFNDIQDPTEDTNQDGIWDANDCPAIVDGCVSSPKQEVTTSSSYNLRVGIDILLPIPNEYTNGLTTADIILIIDWLIEGFPGSQQIISSDWDGNGTVSTSDITEMRRMMLGFDLANTYQNYYVVPKDFVFPTLDPFDFDVDYSNLDFAESDLINNEYEINVFKAGDVNQTASFKSDDHSTTRNVRQLHFEDVLMEAGESYEVPFQIAGEAHLRGALFGLTSADLIFEELNPVQSQSNFLTRIDGNEIAASYISGQSQDQLQFSITMTSLTDGYLSDMLSLDDSIVNGVADDNYTDHTLTLASSSIVSVLETEEQKVTFSPNPVSDYLDIQFTDAQKRSISLTTASGQIISNRITTKSSLRIDRQAEMKSGMYFLRIDATNGTKAYPIIFR